MTYAEPGRMACIVERSRATPQQLLVKQTALGTTILYHRSWRIARLARLALQGIVGFGSSGALGAGLAARYSPRALSAAESSSWPACGRSGRQVVKVCGPWANPAQGPLLGNTISQKTAVALNGLAVAPGT